MKDSFSSELLTQLKASTDLVALISEHVVLKKSGSQWVGLCPFHQERSGSFFVNPSKQLYHCYGCHRGGDSISFIKEMFGNNFPEAVQFLADRAQIPLPQVQKKNTTPDSERQKKLTQAYQLNRFAAAYFHQNLSKNFPIQNYFRSRDPLKNKLFEESWQKTFYLGASSAHWSEFFNHCMTHQAPLPLAVELGLLRKRHPESPATSEYFDFFRNRAIFPVLNLKGQIAGFGGRAIDSEEQPKYLNSPESLIFQKSSLLFGLPQAQKFIREKNEVILVEGYFDVLSMHLAGFQNTVATCGTALTLEHLKLLKRFTTRIILLFDGDTAGQTATLRAMEIGLKQGVILFGAQCPPQIDPDQLLGLPQGVDQMQALIQTARPLLDTSIEEMFVCAERSIEDRVLALKKMGHWLQLLADPVGREIRLQWIQKRLGVSKKLLDLPSSPTSLPPLEIKKASKTPLQPSDRIIFGGLIYAWSKLDQAYLNHFEKLQAQCPENTFIQEWFLHSDCQTFLTQHFDSHFQTVIREQPDSFLEILTDYPEVHQVYTEALLWEQPPFSSSDFQGALVKRLVALWERCLKKIKKEILIAESQQDLHRQDQFRKDYLDVQRKIKDFNTLYD